MLDTSLPNYVFALGRCSPTDQVFHSRGTSLVNFFFLYAKVVRDSHIRLPLDEFSTWVLRTLNVAPTQLHPNSWAYISGFQMLCMRLGLNDFDPFSPLLVYSVG